MTFQELMQQTWARNVAIVTAELVLVLLVFLVLTFALSRCVGRLGRAKSLERIRGAVEVVRHNLRVFLLLGAALVCAVRPRPADSP